MFGDKALQQHLNTLTELVDRDKNRPSVVIWSIANEPTSSKPEAKDYFAKVSQHTKNLDKTRPIGAATHSYFTADIDFMSQSLDILLINRYYGWYSEPGHPDVVQKHIEYYIQTWYDRNKKPIIISEYGVDTVAGLHMDPPFIFSEDYQTEILTEYHKGFDTLRAKGYFIGEMYWNFADFMTGPETKRIMGNKKGVLTRERQPKAGARLLRCRYWTLAGNVPERNTEADNNMYCPQK